MKDRNHMSHMMQHGHHMGGHSQTLIADFTTGNVNKQLITFAMPMFLSHLLQIVYNMADMIIVGQTLGKVGLSAISMAGIVFIYGYNAVSAILRGMGDAKHPFYFISFAAVLNILLDLLFVMKLGAGAKGAALATVISQGVSFLLCAGFIFKNRARYRLHMDAGGVHPSPKGHAVLAAAAGRAYGYQKRGGAVFQNVRQFLD